MPQTALAKPSSLVHAFFTGRFGLFFKYHFQSLLLHFDSNEIVEIRKADADLFSPKPKEPQAIVIAIVSSADQQDSPWRGLASHRPLGGMMRVRKAVYEMARKFRAERNGRVIEEPREMVPFGD